MKTVYDLSALDSVLKAVLPRDHAEIEAKIKEEVKKTASAAFRECYVILPVSGNQYDAYAFASIDCIITLHLKRIYSSKTWKPSKDIYTVDGYRIDYNHRTSVYDDFTVDRIQKRISGHWEHPETVDDTGKAC